MTVNYGNLRMPDSEFNDLGSEFGEIEEIETSAYSFGSQADKRYSNKRNRAY